MISARKRRAHSTQKAQREAGPGLHPRRLAKSIAKAMGAGKDWRQAVASLPRQGQKYLHPERHRTIQQA